MSIKKSNKFLIRSFLAISNIGRGLLFGVFGLLLNYILIHYNSIKILNTYVYFISIYGLFYIFTNWGGKFFNTKEISRNPKESKNLISNLISSKLLLLLFSAVIITFLHLKIELKILMIFFLFLKSLTPIFDSLIIFRKKSQIVFAIEIVLNTTFLVLIFHYSNRFSSFSFLLYFVLLELIKSCYYFYSFWNEISFQFSIKKAIEVLKKSLPFFGLSVGGFIASKSDFYIIGILIDKESMSYYFIISSLLSVSMIIYASLINTFETSIYRFRDSLFQKLENSLKYFGIVFSVIASFGFYVVSNQFYKIPIDLKFTLLFMINIFLFTLINFEMYRYTKLKKQKIILIILIISGAINFAFSFLLIQKMVLFGAFLANTLGILFNFLLLKIYYLKKIRNEV